MIDIAGYCCHRNIKRFINLFENIMKLKNLIATERQQIIIGKHNFENYQLGSLLFLVLMLGLNFQNL